MVVRSFYSSKRERTMRSSVSIVRVIALAVLAQRIFSLLAIPIFFDSTNHLHRDLQYHPEQPERISSCILALDKARQENPDSMMIKLIDVATDASTAYPVQADHQPFSDEELAHAKDILLQIHSKDIVLKLEERCQNSKRQRIQDGKPALGHMGYIDFDTYLTTETFDVCLRATAAWIRAASHNDNNKGITNYGVDDMMMAMALTRPPGHHATRSNQNGFCLFNFAAAAVAHILALNPNARVSVLDWDVHYGQGVADILRDESRARYVSIHQTPAFPYMGEKLQVEGPHRNILTIPMPAETTWTCGYVGLFEKALQFVCKNGEWEPDAVIICAGYDALDSDELASVSLNARDFGQMTSKLIQHLKVSTGKKPKLVFGLEGGYQLGPFAGGGNLQDAVIETVRAMADNR